MTMVHFEAAGTRYCIPVTATRAVRTMETLVTMPGTHDDINGIMPGNPPLTVISPWHGTGPHILVVESGATTFGLLVDTVTGLRRIEDRDVGAAPLGGDQALISGTVESDGRLVLVADPALLAARLLRSRSPAGGPPTIAPAGIAPTVARALVGRS